METRQTLILLRDEARHQFIVRTRVGIESEAIRVGHPIVVPERLERILWRVRHLYQIGSLETGIEAVGFPIMLVPLRVKGEPIGLLLTGQMRAARQRFGEVQRRLFVLVASFASLMIENAKVYDYLRQQFAQRSQELLESTRREVARNGNDQTHHLMVTSIKDPSKVARLLAVSFYKELVRAGFSPDHITAAAAEILDCITHPDRR